MSNTLVHIESTYGISSPRWSLPELVDHRWIKVDGLSSALNYGQQVFDGMKACRSKDGDVLLFRPHDHWKRFCSFSSSLCIPSVPYSHFIECVRQVILANIHQIPSYESKAYVYLRLLVFGSGAKLALSPSDSYTFCVFMQPITAMTNDLDLKGMVIEDMNVSNSCTYDLAGSGATYSPMLRHILEARRKGFLLGLHLDRDNHQYIEGFSDRSFIGVKRSSQGQYCLVVNNPIQRTPSIALDSCLQLAQRLKWRVERRKIRWSELDTFDEILAVNTSSSVVRISTLYYESAGESVDYHSSWSDECSAFNCLKRELLAAQRGERSEFKSWIVRIARKDIEAFGCK